MDRQNNEAPRHWVEDLAASDADIANGDVVPASVVHARLCEAIQALEAEMAVPPIQ